MLMQMHEIDSKILDVVAKISKLANRNHNH